MREKIFKSLNSKDLSHEEWENAAHIVGSLGAAQINQHHLNIGAMLLHLRAGHVRFLPRIVALLSLRIASKARRDGWRGVGRHNADAFARVALDRFLGVLCGDCNGVGTIGELGQLIVTCKTCHGNGKRKDTYRDLAADLNMSSELFKRAGIAERMKDLLSTLDRMEGMAAGATKAQARGI
jgi:hypothetical protein